MSPGRAVEVMPSNAAPSRTARNRWLDLRVFIRIWNSTAERRSGRQFDFDIFQRSAGFIQKAHGSLPAILFIDDFKNDHVYALLQRDLALVCIQHQWTRFAESVNS